jgi:hypothetical protein
MQTCTVNIEAKLFVQFINRPRNVMDIMGRRFSSTGYPGTNWWFVCVLHTHTHTCRLQLQTVTEVGVAVVFSLMRIILW